MKIFLVSKSDWFISKLLIENRLKKSWYWFDSGSSESEVLMDVLVSVLDAEQNYLL